MLGDPHMWQKRALCSSSVPHFRHDVAVTKPYPMACVIQTADGHSGERHWGHFHPGCAFDQRRDTVSTIENQQLDQMPLTSAER
jgi:hypothetical protein